jgi:glutathione S-transferase
MPAIRFWYSPGACSFAPHILLHEIDARFDAVKVPIAESAHLSEAFARINPKQRLPVLALDDEVITELPAIATAISGLAPQYHLMGGNTLDQARVYEWMNWLSGTVHAQGFGALWRPHRFTDDPALHPAISAKGRKTVEECLTIIDRKLTGNYAVGQAFTAVDAFLLVLYRWGNRIGIDMAATYMNFTRFAENLKQRASVQKALAAEGIRIDGSK